jgi:hypothetical protein
MKPLRTQCKKWSYKKRPKSLGRHLTCKDILMQTHVHEKIKTFPIVREIQLTLLTCKDIPRHSKGYKISTGKHQVLKKCLLLSPLPIFELSCLFMLRFRASLSVLGIAPLSGI